MSRTPSGGSEELLSAKNPPVQAEKSQTPSSPDHERLEIFPALLGRRERNLLEDMGGRRLRRRKHQLQMINECGCWRIAHDNGP